MWDYNYDKENAGLVNATRLAKLKELADEKIHDDGKKFHEKTADKLAKMHQDAKTAIYVSVSVEIDRQNQRIAEYEAKKHTAPHYAKLITSVKNKQQRSNTYGKNRKAELEERFKSHMVVELVGLATVTSVADANARTESDRAGMKIVMEQERRRAKTDKERDQVRDVSERDTGYDIETSDRSIEVKSFEGRPSPSMTSHEWATAGKFGDRYWLYVVENVHSNFTVTEIQNPQKSLGAIITKEPITAYRYSFSWTEWKTSNSARG